MIIIIRRNLKLFDTPYTFITYYLKYMIQENF